MLEQLPPQEATTRDGAPAAATDSSRAAIAGGPGAGPDVAGASDARRRLAIGDDRLGASLNRAVERRCRTRTLQRLVGFEVELSVPTFQNVGGPKLAKGLTGREPSRWLNMMFGGGLGRGVVGAVPVPKLDPVTLTGDHNALQRAAAELYDVLARRGLATANGYVPLSNLEYQTAALDEMAAGSDARFKAIATAIDGHATQIFAGDPKTTPRPIAHSTPVYTGIPLTELKSWLGDPLPDDVANKVAALQSSVKWDMYIQATAGVLPTGLESLYKARAAAMPESDDPVLGALKQASEVVAWFPELVLHDPKMKDVNTWLDSAPSVERSLHRSAFRGALAVAMSYAIGNAMNQTTLMRTTVKNAVALMVKLEDISAVAKAGTKWLREHPPNGDMVVQLAEAMHEYPHTNIDHWTQAPFSAAKVDTEQRGPIYGGSGVERTAMFLWGLLTGAEGIEPWAAPGTPLKKLDPVSPAIGGAAAARGQRGLPLEYRWILERPERAGQLWPVFQAVLAEVRHANLRHVPDDKHKAIRESWGKP